MSKSVFLVAGGDHQNLIAIRKAKELGFAVLVVDDHPKCEGAMIADHFEQADLTDRDAMVRIAGVYGIIGAITRTEKAVRSVCYVNDKLGLPSQGTGIDLAVSDKFVMRQLFHQNKIRNLRFFTIASNMDLRAARRELTAMLSTNAVIVKPTDRAGSHGVTKVDRIEQFERAVDRARMESASGIAIVEEYVEGTELGAQCLCEDGEMKLCLLSDKTISGRLVTIGHAYPADIPASLSLEIKEMCRNALDCLGIRNGPATVDIRLSREQIPYIVDIGARVGGNKLPELIRHCAGIDFVKESIRLAAGWKTAFREEVWKPAALLHLHYDRHETVSEIQPFADLLERYRPVDFRLKAKAGTRISPEVRSYGFVMCAGNGAARDCSAFIRKLKRRIVCK